MGQSEKFAAESAKSDRLLGRRWHEHALEGHGTVLFCTEAVKVAGASRVCANEMGSIHRLAIPSEFDWRLRLVVGLLHARVHYSLHFRFDINPRFRFLSPARPALLPSLNDAVNTA